MVEYLSEAKKFIQRAREAYSAEARNQHLNMAEWCISRAIDQQAANWSGGQAKLNNPRSAEPGWS